MRPSTPFRSSFRSRWLAAALGAALFLAGSPAWGAELNYSVSWIGNSLSGQGAWVLQDVEDIFVDADGTLFTNIYWDEAGGNVQQYRDGKLLAMARHTHGWGYEGGDAVAGNSKYLFIIQNVNNEGGHLKGNSWPAQGLSWSGVSRRLRSDITKGAAFPGGHGKEGAVLQGSFLPIVEVPQGQRGGLRGLWATEGSLLVSSPFDSSIKVFDPESMKLVRSWSVQRPDKICLDRNGRLWVLQKPAADEPWNALCFKPDGTPLPPRIAFDRSTIPTDLCVDARNRLLVTDAGPDQDVKIFDQLETAPARAGTLGVRGGILAGPVPGQFGDLRFNNPKGVGVDAQGNLFIASSGSSALKTGGGGSTVIECYSPEGLCKWRVFGLHFIDSADLDPASEADLYTKEEHLVLDFAKAGGQEWSYRAYTVHPFKYRDDPRLHIWSANPWVRRINGQKFLFVTDMTGEFLQVYRFAPQTDGHVAIPCGLLAKKHANLKGGYPPHQPPAGEWIWRDRNANGAIDAGEYLSNGVKNAGGIFVPDEHGSIWHVNGNQIRCLPIQGLDTNGVPLWSYESAKAWDKPAELDQVRRVHYLPGQDLMLLGGNKGEDRNQHWKPMGPVLCCYERWSGPDRKLRWSAVLPYEKGSRGHESAEPISFDVAGDYVFVAYTRGLKADGIRWAFVKVFRLADLSPVGNLSCDTPLGEIGLLDIVQSVRAVKRSNGEYVVFLEDDLKSKVIMFRTMGPAAR